ncbi:hypothetical protein BBJ28_00007300 [Nothophytophthora sp. Chile5]|nr:hypothetical protein BBJ28_00007300 [Nothophytophthora sp. Chile5]
MLRWGGFFPAQHAPLAASSQTRASHFSPSFYRRSTRFLLHSLTRRPSRTGDSSRCSHDRCNLSLHPCTFVVPEYTSPPAWMTRRTSLLSYGVTLALALAGAASAQSEAASTVSTTGVSVCQDATFKVPASRGVVCSGTGAQPLGVQCPRVGDEAMYDCHPYLKSYSGDSCVAWEDAQCVHLAGRATWGCVFPSTACLDDWQTVSDPVPTETQHNVCPTWEFDDGGDSLSRSDLLDVEGIVSDPTWFMQTTALKLLHDCGSKSDASVIAPTEQQETAAASATSQDSTEVIPTETPSLEITDASTEPQTPPQSPESTAVATYQPTGAPETVVTTTPTQVNATSASQTPDTVVPTFPTPAEPTEQSSVEDTPKPETSSPTQSLPSETTAPEASVSDAPTYSETPSISTAPTPTTTPRYPVTSPTTTPTSGSVESVVSPSSIPSETPTSSTFTPPAMATLTPCDGVTSAPTSAPSSETIANGSWVPTPTATTWTSDTTVSDTYETIDATPTPTPTRPSVVNETWTPTPTPTPTPSTSAEQSTDDLESSTFTPTTTPSAVVTLPPYSNETSTPTSSMDVTSAPTSTATELTARSQYDSEDSDDSETPTSTPSSTSSITSTPSPYATETPAPTPTPTPSTDEAYPYPSETSTPTPTTPMSTPTVTSAPTSTLYTTAESIQDEEAAPSSEQTSAATPSTTLASTSPVASSTAPSPVSSVETPCPSSMSVETTAPCSSAHNSAAQRLTLQATTKADSTSDVAAPGISAAAVNVIIIAVACVAVVAALPSGAPISALHVDTMRLLRVVSIVLVASLAVFSPIEAASLRGASNNVKEQDCGAPPSPYQGSVKYTSTKAGSTATYSCMKGTTMRGASSSRCTAHGIWSPQSIECRVTYLAAKDNSFKNNDKGYDLYSG